MTGFQRWFRTTDRINNMRTILLCTALILLAGSSRQLIAQHGPPPQAVKFDLTTEQWREDLRYFAEELPKLHKNAFHNMTREQFARAVRQLDAEIPGLTSEEIFVRFIKLASMVSDGHTSIEEQALQKLPLYPIRFEYFEDGLFVTSAALEYREIVGGKVIKIGNTPVDQAVTRTQDISWGDNGNEQSLKDGSSFMMTIPKILKGLKIADSDNQVSLTVEKDGQQKSLELKPVNDMRSFFTNGQLAYAYQQSKDPIPLYLRNSQNNYWFEYVEKTKVLYVHINQLINKPDESVAVFFKKVFDFSDSNPVDKFVLDLRANTGGNLLLNKPIIIGLIRSRHNERGKLFVVIGRRTFSAAQWLVNELEKYTNAIFVGEPTGSSPNLYADPVIMTLPNSRLPFRVATLWHQTDPTDARTFTAPELFTPVTSEDFRNNIDPVFQAIVEYIPGSTFKDLAAHGEDSSDISGFIAKYRKFKTGLQNRYLGTEADMNALGYRLIRAKRIKDGLEIFKLNVEAYPASHNVYDSLAEAYLLDGNREEAIKNYEKALKINPNFQSSVDALRKLKAMP